MKRTYYYLHTNGALLKKPAIVVESCGVNDYFNSPFVRKYWVATTEKDIKQIELEARTLVKLGAKADGFKMSSQALENPELIKEDYEKIKHNGNTARQRN